MERKKPGDVVNNHHGEAEGSCAYARMHTHSHNINFQPGIKE